MGPIGGMMGSTAVLFGLLALCGLGGAFLAFVLGPAIRRSDDPEGMKEAAWFAGTTIALVVAVVLMVELGWG